MVSECHQYRVFGFSISTRVTDGQTDGIRTTEVALAEASRGKKQQMYKVYREPVYDMCDDRAYTKMFMLPLGALRHQEIM